MHEDVVVAGGPLFAEAVRRPGRLCEVELCRRHVTGDRALDRLTHLTQRILDVPIALISFIDDHVQLVQSAAGVDLEPGTIAGGTALAAADVRRHPVLSAVATLGDIHTKAYAGVPIRLRSGPVANELDLRRTVSEANDSASRILGRRPEELAMSVGVTSCEGSCESAEIDEIVRRADRLMYARKQMRKAARAAEQQRTMERRIKEGH